MYTGAEVIFCHVQDIEFPLAELYDIHFSFFNLSNRSLLSTAGQHPGVVASSLSSVFSETANGTLHPIVQIINESFQQY